MNWTATKVSPTKRSLLMGLVAALSFFVGVVAVSQFLIDRSYLGGRTVTLALYSLPSTLVWAVMAAWIGRRLGLRSYMAMPVVAIIGAAAYLVLQAIVLRRADVGAAYAMAIQLLILTLVLVPTTYIVEITNRSALMRVLGAAVAVLYVAGLLAGAKGIEYVLTERRSEIRLAAYNVVDFPLYLPKDSMSGSSNLQDVSAGVEAAGLIGPLVDFHMDGRTPDSFSMSKYPGFAPAPSCQPEYGGDRDEVSFKEWRCESLYEGAGYTLYKRHVVYFSEVVAGMPQEPRYAYFAVFGDDTVVWYGYTYNTSNATEVPLGVLRGFYDSLAPYRVTDPGVVAILRNL